MVLSRTQVRTLLKAGSFTVGKIKVVNVKPDKVEGGTARFFGLAVTNPSGDALPEPQAVVFNNAGDPEHPGKVVLCGNDILYKCLGVYTADEFKYTPDEFKLPDSISE
jgi:hypothetical protein